MIDKAVDRRAGTHRRCAGPARRVHDQDVEANAVGAPVRVFSQDDLAGADSRDCWRTVRAMAASARVGRDFTSTIDRMPAFSATASTSPAGAQAAGVDGPAVGDQGGTGGVLGGDAVGIGGAACLAACSSAQDAREFAKIR